ncbi:helix-turn-helix domain-containing protein [Fuerstiella marisgermanici]|uniref:Uncharacterized protein n=1 Tax=Fuerstiella marisgermanici TaxID=1891926 RepID=A0A1P8WB63_9PLAN|nr:helix-turn-helix domain-containing protein [Fuerstiella marisgermanici]APZ91310.1 hypothetical protein Fuma_00898 [Fuerstiella marisgermanici]
MVSARNYSRNAILINGKPCLQHPLYSVWRGMVQRCTNKRAKGYRDYGRRGIRVCPEWREGDGVLTGFQCFLRDMGERPSKRYQLDRRDGNGDYCKDNCRWLSQAENIRNSSATTFRRLQVSIAKRQILEGASNREIAATYGVHHSTVSDIRRNRTWADIQPAAADHPSVSLQSFAESCWRDCQSKLTAKDAP